MSSVKVFGPKKSSYYSHEEYLLEQARLFNIETSYLGSASEFLKLNKEIIPIDNSNGEWLLIQEDGQFKNALRNRCLHRGAKMITKACGKDELTCPLHGWRYGESGACKRMFEVVNSGEIKNQLESRRVYQFADFLFFESSEHTFLDFLRTTPELQKFGIDNFVFRKQFMETYDTNWKLYIELFEENYHVPFVHPGFSKFVDISSLKWNHKKNYTTQIFKSPKKLFDDNYQMKTPKYQKWVNLLKQFTKNTVPEFAAVMVYFYPNLIVEVFPFCMAICTIQPIGPSGYTTKVDFYHDRRVLEEFPELAMAAEEALNETETEDMVSAKNLVQIPNDSVIDNSLSEYHLHEHFEHGLIHFYRYYLEKMSL